MTTLDWALFWVVAWPVVLLGGIYLIGAAHALFFGLFPFLDPNFWRIKK